MEGKKKQSVDFSLILGYIATKELETVEKKVAILTQFGYSNADMAIICGASGDVIKTLKSRAKMDRKNE